MQKYAKKIENRGCHGNGGVDLKIYAFLFITRQKLKNRQSFRKLFFFFFFFFFQPILTVTGMTLKSFIQRLCLVGHLP